MTSFRIGAKSNKPSATSTPISSPTNTQNKPTQSSSYPQVSQKNKASQRSRGAESVVWPIVLDRARIFRTKHKMSSAGDLQFAPMRTLDDFILTSARFQLPNFADFERWGNRVVKNLCYYQTNYFIVSAIWMVLVLIYQPKVVLMATSIILAGVVGARLSTNMDLVKRILCMALPCVGLLYFLDLILFVVFVFLVPFCFTFVHSSLRLRNMKNKVMNTVESLGIQNTPMGIFLSQMGLLPDGIL